MLKKKVIKLSFAFFVSLILLLSSAFAADFSAASVSTSDPIFVSGYDIGVGETSFSPYIHISFHMKTSKTNLTNFSLISVDYNNYGAHEYWESFAKSITINNMSSSPDGDFKIRLRSFQSFEYEKLTNLTLYIRDESTGNTYRIPVNLNETSSGNKLVNSYIQNNTGTNPAVGKTTELESVVELNGVSPIVDLLTASKEQTYQWSSNVTDEVNTAKFSPTIAGTAKINCDVLYQVSTSFASTDSTFYIKFPLTTGYFSVGGINTSMSVFSDYAKPVIGRNYQYETNFRTAADFKAAIDSDFGVTLYNTTESDDISVIFNFQNLLSYASLFETAFQPQAKSMLDADFVYSINTATSESSAAVDKLIAALNEELANSGISANIPITIKEGTTLTASTVWRINLGKTSASQPSSSSAASSSSSSGVSSSSQIPHKTNGQIDTFSIKNTSDILAAASNGSSQLVIEVQAPSNDPTKLDSSVLAEIIRVKSLYPDKMLKIRYYNDKGTFISEIGVTAAYLNTANTIDAKTSADLSNSNLIKAKAGDIKYQPINFQHSGALGGTFAIRIRADESFLSGIDTTKKLYLYKLNYDKDRLEYITDYVLLDKYNFFNFPLISCSEYIITNTRISNAVTTDQTITSSMVSTGGNSTKIPSTGEFQFIGLAIIIGVLLISMLTSTLLVNKVSKKIENKKK